MLVLLAQHLVDGIVSGAILALPALGLALIWRIAGFPHLAHGSLITIGAYVAWAAVSQANIALPVAIVFALIAAALVGVAMHKGVYSRLAGQPMFSLFLASIGIELFLRYGTILTFGSDFRTFPFPPQRGIRFGIITITPNALILLLVALAALLAVWWLLRRTRIGREMRCVADNLYLARLNGISPERALLAMWVVASVLAGIAGILLGVRNVLTPTLGWDILLLAFAAAILGGIANPFGAAVGAFLMGIVSQVGILWLPSSYGPGIAFVLIIIVLVVRPHGLFGESARI